MEQNNSFYQDNWRKNFMKDSFRAGQDTGLDAMAKHLDAGIKYVIGEFPTGTGKSCMAMTMAKTARDAYIATSQNILIEQYESEFSKERGFSTVKGKKNYECCGGYENCDIGTKKNCKCTRMKIYETTPLEDIDCNYLYAKHRAMRSDICFTNTKYYALACGSWGKRKLAVIDEAHNIASDVMSMTSISINDFTLTRVLRLSTPFPKFNVDNSDVKDCYPVEIGEFADFLMQLQEELYYILERSTENVGFAFSYDMDEVKSMYDKVMEFLNTYQNGQRWIVDYYPERGKMHRKLVAQPIDTGYFAQKKFFDLQAKQYILQSATIVDKIQFAKECGIELGLGQVVSVVRPSPFDLSRRPIAIDSVGNINNSNLKELLPSITQKVIRALELRPDQKGIVHTNSYAIQKHLQQALGHNRRCLFPDSSTRALMLEEHFSSSKPTVLFSPSMTEGVDGIGDMVRFQIICKVPYPNLGDRRIKIKMQEDTGWYHYQTAKTLIQAIGRGMRSPDDWCHNIILDGGFNRFANMYNLPKDVTSTIVGISELERNL